ncbi:hypothetical protein D3C87_1362280 [compost metagenome]
MPATIGGSVVRKDGDLIQRQTVHFIAFVFNQPFNWVDIRVVSVQMLVERQKFGVARQLPLATFVWDEIIEVQLELSVQSIKERITSSQQSLDRLLCCHEVYG